MTILDFTIIGKDLSGATFDKLGGSLDKLLVKTEALNKQKVNIKIDVDEKGAVSKLTATSTAIDDVENRSKKSSGTSTLAKGIVGLGVAAAGAAAVSAHLALNFEDATNKMAVQGNIPIDLAKKIGDGFLDTAFKSGKSATELEEAFTPVIGKLSEVQGHSVSAAESLDFMRSAGAANVATGGDLAQTVGAMADVMQTYGLKIGDSARESDILTRSSQLMNVPISDLAGGLDKMKGRLGELAPSLQDSATLMAELNQHGLTGTKAVTGMTGAITSLLNPSKEGAGAIKDLGLRTVDSKGHFVGMDSIIAQLGPKFAHMTQQQKLQTSTLLFGKPVAETMNSVIAEGVTKYKALGDQLTQANAAQDAAAKRGQDLSVQWGKVKAGLTDVGIRVGQALIPVLSKIVDIVGPIIKSIGDWITANPKLTTAILIGVSALGILVGAIWGVSSAWKILSTAFSASPIVLVIGAIVLAGIAIYKFRDQIKSGLKAAWDFIVSIFNHIKDFFLQWGPAILAALVPFLGIPLLIFQHWGQISAFFEGLWSNITGWISRTWNDAWKIVSDALSAIRDFFVGIWNGIWKDTSNKLTAIRDFFVSIWNGIVTFVTGIPGALASAGEHMWDWLVSGLKNTLNGAIWLLNQGVHAINFILDGISSVWTWIPGLGSASIPHIPDIPSLAAGGYVSGSGSGTSDSIPAQLSNGEFVVNANATSKNLALLTWINAQKFAKGGLVGFATGGLVAGGDGASLAATALTSTSDDSFSQRIQDQQTFNDLILNTTDSLQTYNDTLTAGEGSDQKTQLDSISDSFKQQQVDIDGVTSSLKNVPTDKDISITSNTTEAVKSIDGLKTQIASDTLPAKLPVNANTEQAMATVGHAKVNIATDVKPTAMPVNSNTVLAMQTVDKAKIAIATDKIPPLAPVDATTRLALKTVADAKAAISTDKVPPLAPVDANINPATAAVNAFKIGATNPPFAPVVIPAVVNIQWDKQPGQSGFVGPVDPRLLKPGTAGGPAGPAVPATANPNSPYYQHRQLGGLVLGPGTKTSDSIPAWLSNGEFVVNANATAKFLPLLSMINARRFADGGLVSGSRTPNISMGSGGTVKIEIVFAGNTDGALATAFMKMIRDNKIQIRQKNIVGG